MGPFRVEFFFAIFGHFVKHFVSKVLAAHCLDQRSKKFDPDRNF